MPRAVCEWSVNFCTAAKAGFRTLIERHDRSLLRFMTVHHLLKSYYLVMLARPLMWLWCEIGLRLCQAANVDIDSGPCCRVQAGGYTCWYGECWLTHSSFL